MLRRAVLPLTRPNALVSAPRLSAIPVSYPRCYAKNSRPKTPYKLPESVKSSKSEQSAKSSPQEQYAAEQAEFETKADPEANTANTTSQDPDSSPTQPKQDAPKKPLPDLTQGIPSTLFAEMEAREKKGGSGQLNLTEDPSRFEEEYSDDGGGDIPKGGYESSLDRKRARMAKLMYALFLLGSVGGMAYLGRNWDTAEEEKVHPHAPSGWGLGLWYNRVKARLGDITSYYKDPAFPKLLPDEDPNLRQPYTLVLSLEDLLVHSEWSREHGWRVAKRPGIDYFLRYLNQYYELVLFTSVPSMMADQVLRKLDPYRIIRWPLFREATRYKDGEYIKVFNYSEKI